MTETLDRKGLRAALITYSLWGLVPLYWKLLQHVAPLELMIQRVIWSALFYFVLIQVLRRPRTKMDRHVWIRVSAAGLLLSLNWYAYVTAVNTSRVLEASLAYFLTPLFNVGLARFVFGEKLSRPLKFALIFAGLGIGLMFTKVQNLPWLALSMALSFSLYGMLKKQMPLRPLDSAFYEMLALLPMAGLILFFLRVQGPPHAATDWLLVATSGVVTGLPLIFFAQAAQLLPYSVLGFFQFLPPTTAFLLALGLYHEPFEWRDFVGFALIWVGVALYLLSLTGLRPKARRRDRDLTQAT